MSSPAVEASWPEDVQNALSNFKQGDVIDSPPAFSYYGDANHPLGIGQPTPAAGSATREFDFIDVEHPYGIITTQTCDLVEEGEPAQPYFQACPVYRLGHAGRLPTYLAPLDPPDLPEGVWVADFRLESSFEKTVLVGRTSIAAFPDEPGYLDFARQLGRRKERPAVATPLVDAVAGSLKHRKANSSGFKRMMREDLHSVRLAIDEGTRLAPAVARVHFIGQEELDPETRDRLDTWWQKEAYPQAGAAGIDLLPNEYHDNTLIPIDLYERTIPLNL